MKAEIVAKAFDELVAAGVEPSLRRVRERIGSGSMTDLGRIIGEIREARRIETEAATTFPDHVRELSDRYLLQLWSTLMTEAQEKIAAAEAACDRRVEQTRRAETAALQEADRLQFDLDAVREELTAARAEIDGIKAAKSALETELVVARRIFIDAQTRAAGLQHSLDLAILGGRPTPVELPVAEGVPSNEMAAVYEAIRRALTEGVEVYEGELDHVGLVNQTSRLLDAATEALVAAGLLESDSAGKLTLPSKSDRIAP